MPISPSQLPFVQASIYGGWNMQLVTWKLKKSNIVSWGGMITALSRHAYIKNDIMRFDLGDSGIHDGLGVLAADIGKDNLPAPSANCWVPAGKTLADREWVQSISTSFPIWEYEHFSTPIGDYEKGAAIRTEPLKWVGDFKDISWFS